MPGTALREEAEQEGQGQGGRKTECVASGGGRALEWRVTGPWKERIALR